MDIRDLGWRQSLPLALPGQSDEGGRCVTQGFPGKEAGWGPQRRHPTQVGAVAIQEGFLEEVAANA